MFDFFNDPATITPSIKEGFGRLDQLDLMCCRGDTSMFVNHSPVTKLQSLKYLSIRDPVEARDIISSFAMKCRSLKSVDLWVKFDSSEFLLNTSEFCRGIEYLRFVPHNLMILKKSDIEAIACLPSLKRLEISRSNLTEDVISPFTRCKKLKSLYLRMDFSLLRPVLAVIGRQLSGLNLGVVNSESLDGIVEYCPNLECLYLYFVEEVEDEEGSAALETLIKNRMKRLKV
jgi:hypothetical protein